MSSSGCWGFVIRNKQVAQKLADHFSTLTWHIDLSISQLSRERKLKVYGCIPVLVSHAGSLRISSWNYTQVGRWQNGRLKTDTNS